MKQRILSAALGVALLLAACPAQAANVKDTAFLITAQVQSRPPEIRLSWEAVVLYDGMVAGAPNVITIERKLPGDTAWRVLDTLSIDAAGYADRTVEAGIAYQYRVSSYYNKPGVTRTEAVVSCGIDLPAADDRGKMILLTDRDTEAALREKLHRLTADLTADGWQVIRRSVARSDDPHAAAAVKAVVKEVYDSDPQRVKSLFLFGHVPVPLLGWSNYDGHGARPFPGDVFYADLDGNWTDETVNRTGSGQFADRSNLPGDGIYDQDSAPSAAELTYGRVDLYDLPLFAPLTEFQLLERYLDKDHAYRMGELDLPNRAMIQNGFNAYAETGYEVLSVLCGGSAAMTEENYLTELPGRAYAWQYIDGPGQYDRVGYEEHGVYGYAWREAVETEDFVYNKFQSLFSMMYGSYMGEWNSQNNILRAYLAMPEYGLTNLLGAQSIQGLALGQTFGEAVAYAGGAPGNVPRDTAGNMRFFGDPGLTLYPVRPVYHLRGQRTPEGNALTWLPPSDSEGRTIVGYHVYRADSDTGVFERLTDVPVTQPVYIDAAPDADKPVYLVRCVAKVTSPAGTFYKIGQGSTVSMVSDMEVCGVAFRHEGQVCSRLPADGVVTATATLSNHTAQAKDVTVLAALYAADGHLKRMEFRTAAIAGAGQEIAVNLPVDGSRAGDYAAAYVWESIEDKVSMTGVFSIAPR